MKTAVAGTWYVGLSIATLLAQHNEVIVVDIIPKKVKLINDILSPIKDEYIKKYFKKENLNLYATLDYENAYRDADFVIIATPTNYDSDKNYFDTSAVEDVIKQVIKIKSQSKHFIERVFGTKTILCIITEREVACRLRI